MKRLHPFKLAFALAVLIALVFAMPALSAGLITGGGGWQWSNPSVQGNTINSVSFVDGNTGYAAGIGGTVIKTVNGGASWDAKIPSTMCGAVPTAGCNLNGIDFISATEGWVVGDYGTIWHTLNGGDSWTSQTSNLPASGCAGGGTCTSTFLKDVDLINGTNGLAVGDGYAFGTVDDGATWTKVNSITTSHYLSSVNMLSTTSGVIVGSDGAIYTVAYSAGVWTATQRTSGTLEAMRSVYFNDSLRGFAVGGNTILRTGDGGLSWVKGTTSGVQLWGVTVSGNNLFISGGTAGASNGAIYKRSSGNLWSDPMSTVAAGLTPMSAGTTSQILALAMPTASTGFAAGEAGAITKTTNTGSNWSLVAGGNAKGISRASFVDDTTGWMVARDGSVMKTVDGGNNWASDSVGIAANTSLQDVDFIDEGIGFAVGYSGSNGVAYKYKSGTWSPMTVPAGVASLWGIHMTSATSGWAVGIPPSSGATTGVALRTTDGLTWTNVATGLGTDIQLYGVDTTDPATDGWAVGQRTGGDGVLAKYSGGSWTYIEKVDTSFFSSIDMVNSSTGFAVGYDGGPPASGRGYKTIDGGASWNSTPVGTSKLLSDVSFVDANNGYASGDEGRVIKTINGGTSWTLEGVGSSVGMNTVVAVPSSFAPSGIAAFVGGFNAAALRTIEDNEVISVSTTGVRVARGDDISATFNRDLNAATIESPATSFSIVRQSDMTPVAGTVTYDNPTRTATFNPTADLDYATTYEATLTTAITGGGVPLERNYTWTFSTARDYWWTWYDNQSTGASNWVLMANPDSATQSINYRLSIADTDKSLAGWNNGVVAPGGNSLTPQYPTVIGGPVNAASITDGSKGIVSQRILWGQNSLEEVLGTDGEKLSNHFYWTWYDDLSTGYTNYVMVANPGTANVFYRVKVAGVPKTTGEIVPGDSAFWRDGTLQGGPVEVEGCQVAFDPIDITCSSPADVLASQRVLSNSGGAFNELVGTAETDLSSDYVWTWYDNHSPGAQNWIMIANPGAVDMYYEIWIGGELVQDDTTGGGPIPAGGYIFPTFGPPDVPAANGPVQVKTFSGTPHNPATNAMNSIASQRIIWGPSFGEVPGYPNSLLTNTYHWTWYDQSQANVFNWVMVAKQDFAANNVYYKVLVAGVERKACTQIPAEGRDVPAFPGVIGGPVEVRSYSDASCTVLSAPGNGIMASQRVLWKGYFNETLGTDLS